MSLKDTVIKVRVEAQLDLDRAKGRLMDLLNLQGIKLSSAEMMALFGSADGRATGGPVDAGTPYIVGEKGPELFVPSGYGKIVDAFSTNKALLSNAGGGMGSGGGGNVTINVTVSPTADKASIGQTIVEAISSYERRSGPGWRS
jgi:phage-related minor tail protein